MLVDRLNEGADDVKAVASFVGQLTPETAYLSIPTRPPARSWVRAPGEAAVNRAFQILSEAVNRVELLTGYEGADFACSGEAREDLLGVASVHPIREDGLRSWLEKAGADWSLVEDLLRDAALVAAEYNGRRFFLRNLQGTVMRRTHDEWRQRFRRLVIQDSPGSLDVEGEIEWVDEDVIDPQSA
jgi:hypothetical protein